MQTQSPSNPYGPPSGSPDGGGGAQEKAQDAAGQAQQKASELAGQVQDGAQDLVGQARSQVRAQIDQRSSQAAEQVNQQASDLRTVSQTLREQGKDGPAQAADRLAEYAEKVGGYLRDKDADQLLHDAEDLGRRKPWAAAGAGLVLGLTASRFLKASSRQRYSSLSSGGYGAGTPSRPGPATPSATPASTVPPSTVPAPAVPAPAVPATPGVAGSPLGSPATPGAGVVPGRPGGV